MAIESVQGHLRNARAVVKYMLDNLGQEPEIPIAGSYRTYKAWSCTQLQSRGLDISVRTLAEMENLGYIQLHSEYRRGRGQRGYILTESGKLAAEDTSGSEVMGLVLNELARIDRDTSSNLWELEKEYAVGPTNKAKMSPGQVIAWYEKRATRLLAAIQTRRALWQMQLHAVSVGYQLDPLALKILMEVFTPEKIEQAGLDAISKMAGNESTSKGGTE